MLVLECQPADTYNFQIRRVDLKFKTSSPPSGVLEARLKLDASQRVAQTIITLFFDKIQNVLSDISISG